MSAMLRLECCHEVMTRLRPSSSTATAPFTMPDNTHNHTITITQPQHHAQRGLRHRTHRTLNERGVWASRYKYV